MALYVNSVTVTYKTLNHSFQLGDTLWAAIPNTNSLPTIFMDSNENEYNPYVDVPPTMSTAGTGGWNSDEVDDYYDSNLYNIKSMDQVVRLGQVHKITGDIEEGFFGPDYTDLGLAYMAETDPSAYTSTSMSYGSDRRIRLEFYSADVIEDEIPSNAYIFFTKDKRANQSSVTGYYGQARFKNTSRNKAELYVASTRATESSK